MKAADVAEDFEEDFLGDVGGVCGVLEGADDDGVDGLVVLGDELGEGLLGAGFELGHEGGFLGGNRYRTGQLVQGRARLHSGYLIRYDVVKGLANDLR